MLSLLVVLIVVVQGTLLSTVTTDFELRQVRKDTESGC